MASEPNRQDGDDVTMVLQMVDRDPEGLRALLRVHGPFVLGWLTKRYSHVLSAVEIEGVLNQAAFNVWRFADRYDESKGALGGWFLRIARNAAVNILKGENKHCHKSLEYNDGYDPASAHDEERDDLTTLPDRGSMLSHLAYGPRNSGVEKDDPPTVKELERRRLDNDLDDVIAKLPPLQKAIVLADFAACDGSADSKRLAELHGSTKNSIEVSRNKARKTIRDELLKRSHFQNSNRRST